jgi:hypothetical protein
MQFRTLDPKEEAEFRQYARSNPDEARRRMACSGGWEVIHPICRDEWTKMGIGPDVKYRICIMHSEVRRGQAYFLGELTLDQGKQLIETLDMMWGSVSQGHPAWFQPISEIWEGCDVAAIDKDGDVIFFYADGWEEFLDGGGPNETDDDLSMPDEDMP